MSDQSETGKTLSMADKIRIFEGRVQGDDDAMIEELRRNAFIKDRTESHSPDSHHHQFQHHHHNSTTPRMNEEGLILPRKLVNPCLESREVQDLNKEIKWNAKTGVNVLDRKSELERVMEKRKFQQKEHQKRLEQEASKSDFQKMLENRAKRLDELEKKTVISTSSATQEEDGGDSGHCSPEPEFVKVHAQLKHLAKK